MIRLFNVDVRVSDAMISLAFATLILLIISILITRKRSLKPGNAQSLGESFFSLVEGACTSMGLKDEHSEQVIPFVASLGLMIVFSNLTSLFKVKPASLNPLGPYYISDY